MNAWIGLAFDMTPALNPAWSLLILLSSGLIAFFLAIFLFNWDSKNTRRGRSPLLALLTLIPYVLGVIFLAG
jgi:hypothetical protein